VKTRGEVWEAACTPVPHFLPLHPPPYSALMLHPPEQEMHRFATVNWIRNYEL
jgi:hypothetical protein